ncbi:MAG: hypothetical protein AB7I27_19395 [Bacteriovoracaceae bacterium]
MNILPKIYTLKDEAQIQLYDWFDKEVRALPKKSDGTINPFAEGLVDNDIDALGHAFVSGVYVLEFDEQTSEIMGRLNELGNLNYSPSSPKSENMDLWNNAVGREVAKKVKNCRELYELLLKSMKAIISPDDKRRFKGEKIIKRMPKSFVIKIKENKTGANIEFLDVRRKVVLSKSEFVGAIRSGKYPGYAVRKHHSGEFPYSMRDKFSFNNLG